MGDVFEGEVIEVYSGDDLMVMVNLGVDDLYKRRRVRLHGVDTPNAVGLSANTEAGKMRAYVRDLCRDKKVRITVMAQNMRSCVAVVEVLGKDGAININEDLISKGYKFIRERQNDR